MNDNREATDLTIIAILDKIAPFLFLLSVASSVVALINGVRLLKQRKQVSFTLWLLFIGILNGCFMLPVFYLVPNAARSEIHCAASCIEEGQGTLLIDGKEIEDASPYTTALKNIRWFMVGHHSIPTHPRIDLELETAYCQVYVRLMRDSVRQDEYWVFFPKYQTTAENDVGRIYLYPPQ